MQKTFKILILLLLSNQSGLLGQEIDIKPIEVDRLHRRIIVPYSIRDLKETHYQYNIQLFYSQDAGASYQGPLEQVEGHIGPEMLADTQKIIIWHYFRENPRFYGNNVQFKIRAIYEKSVLDLYGPKRALLSVPVPGLGNRFVRHLEKKWHWVYVTAPTTLLVGSAVYLKHRSNQTYQHYLQAQNNAEANRLFDRSVQQNRLAVITGGIGLSLWVADIVQALYKGTKNQRGKKRLEEKNRPIDLQNISLRYRPVGGYPAFSFIIHF
ncbi:MAG: hypothetical protein HC880_07490 [Bacteroidia bacterium]|nr:hypothetical protein [Bacteroidia bacterium]